jgi:hypothetical protein
MAFEYTRSKAGFGGTAPSLRVAVDTTAGDAFTSLQKMMTTLGTSYTDNLKAEAKSLETSNYNSAVQLIDTVSAVAERKQTAIGSSNMDEQGKIAQVAIEDMDYVFSNLDVDSQKDLVKYYQTRRTKVIDQLTKYENEFRERDYENTVGHNASLLIELSDIDPNATARAYKANVDYGVTYGRLSPEDSSKKLFNSTFNRFFSSFDMKEAVRTGDVATLNRGRQMIEVAKAADPRLENKDYYLTQKNKLDTMESEMRNRFSTDLTALKEGEQWDAWQAKYDQGRQSGLIDETAGKIAIGKRNKAMLSSKTYKQNQANALILKHGLGIPTSAIADKDQQKLVNNMVTEQLVTQFATGRYDITELQAVANNNFDTYKKAYRPAMSRDLGALRTALSMTTKTPEEDEAKQRAVSLAYNKAKQMQGLGFDSAMTKEHKIKMQAMEAVMAGHIQNAPKFFDAMDELGGMKEIPMIAPTSDDYVKAFKKELPIDDYVEAQRHYSVLIAGGMDREAAQEIVANVYDYEGVDGNKAEFSGSLREKMSDSGFTADNQQYFETLLTDPDTFGFSPDTVAIINSIQEGTNTRFSYDQGSLVMQNDEGGYLNIPLTEQQWQSFSEAASEKYVADNPRTGVLQTIDDVGGAVADHVYEKATQAGLFYDVLKNVTGLDQVKIEESPLIELGNTLKDMPSKFNQMYHEMMYEGKDFWDAAGVLKDQKKGKIIRNEEIDKALENADANSQGESPQNKVMKAVEAVVDAVIGKAEAADIGDQAVYNFEDALANRMEGWHGGKPIATKDSREKDQKKKSRDIGFGHNITEAEEASGMIHGIRFKDANGKYIELTKAQSRKIMQADLEENVATARKMGWDAELAAYGYKWDDIDTSFQLALGSLAYNIGGSGAAKYKKAVAAAADGAVLEFAKEMRRMDQGKHTKAMDNRVVKELYYAGIIDSLATVKSVLPLATEKVENY